MLGDPRFFGKLPLFLKKGSTRLNLLTFADFSFFLDVITMIPEVTFPLVDPKNLQQERVVEPWTNPYSIYPKRHKKAATSKSEEQKTEKQKKSRFKKGMQCIN